MVPLFHRSGARAGKPSVAKAVTDGRMLDVLFATGVKASADGEDLGAIGFGDRAAVDLTLSARHVSRYCRCN